MRRVHTSPLILAGIALALAPGGLSGQQFEDDFEDYPVGTPPPWNSSSGVQVTHQSLIPEFGATNRLINLAGSNQKLLTDTTTYAPGQVLTLAVDLLEYDSGTPASGLQLGFGTNKELNVANGSARVSLLDGVLSHSTLGGDSVLTGGGPTGYPLGEAFRLYMVVNDTDTELTDYQESEDLAAHSFEVWIRAGSDIQPVFEATIARSLDVAGFRTWPQHDSDFFADNFRLSLGVDLTLRPCFGDDFESTEPGAAPSWSGVDVVTVEEGAPFPDGAADNRAVAFDEASGRLLQNVAVFSVGKVTTLSADLVETESGTPTNGLQFGFGSNGELNAANSAARVQLLDGAIVHNDIGGLSSLTQMGTATYPVGETVRIHMVVNDRAEPLTDYEGTEDLAADSYEVWIRTDAGLQHVLEATLARDPRDAGFRAFSGLDAVFHVDNVRVDKGAQLAEQVACDLSQVPPGVPAGDPFELEFKIRNAPPGSTYRLVSSADLTAPGAAPVVESGQLTATIGTGNRIDAALILEVRDSGGALLASSGATVRVFDYRLPHRLHHPSIVSSAGQLARMSELILNEPASTARLGWDAMVSTSWASLDHVPDPQQTVQVVPAGGNESEAAFRNDGIAARAHALQWVVTGDPAHRDKCLEILNIWGKTFRSITQEPSSIPQIRLESAWALPVWLSAADIMRYHVGGAAGWDPADMACFHHFMDVLYREAYKARNQYNNNWDVSACLGMMAYGAWTDDEAIFDEGLSEQLARLDGLSEPTGRIPEVCRDTWHPQYTVVAWTDSAELARNQGRMDLYEATFDGQTTPRLAIILEYFAQLMLGDLSPGCGGGFGYSYFDAIHRFDNYEVPYNHYIRREQAGYLPVFTELIEDFWRAEGGDDPHFLLWSRMTHGDNDFDALPLPDTYDEWIATALVAHGVTDPAETGPQGDPNRDGVSNELHYRTGTPAATRTGDDAIVRIDGASEPGAAVLRLVERPDADAYGRHFLWSADLHSWSRIDPALLVQLEDRGPTVVNEATFDTPGKRGFFRVGYPPVR